MPEYLLLLRKTLGCFNNGLKALLSSAGSARLNASAVELRRGCRFELFLDLNFVAGMEEGGLVDPVLDRSSGLTAPLFLRRIYRSSI